MAESHAFRFPSSHPSHPQAELSVSHNSGSGVCSPCLTGTVEMLTPASDEQESLNCLFDHYAMLVEMPIALKTLQIFRERIWQPKSKSLPESNHFFLQQLLIIPRVSRTWVPNHMFLWSFGLRKKKKQRLYLGLKFWRSQDHFWMVTNHSLVEKASHSHERADGLCNQQTVLRRLQRKWFLSAVVLGEGVCVCLDS